jgi:DTW domain-containing protein YfiP
MPPALIVPDGNWKQASRMVKRLSLLADATKVSLPNRILMGQPLRRNHIGHRMSTYEAVVQALAILEGETITEPLLDFYRRAVDRMLLVRGQLKRGDVYGGVPYPLGLSRRTSPLNNGGRAESLELTRNQDRGRHLL